VWATGVRPALWREERVARQVRPDDQMRKRRLAATPTRTLRDLVVILPKAPFERGAVRIALAGVADGAFASTAAMVASGSTVAVLP
jgi:hypothetical protein